MIFLILGNHFSYSQEVQRDTLEILLTEISSQASIPQNRYPYIESNVREILMTMLLKENNESCEECFPIMKIKDTLNININDIPSSWNEVNLVSAMNANGFPGLFYLNDRVIAKASITRPKFVLLHLNESNWTTFGSVFAPLSAAVDPDYIDYGYFKSDNSESDEDYLALCQRIASVIARSSYSLMDGLLPSEYAWHDGLPDMVIVNGDTISCSLMHPLAPSHPEWVNQYAKDSSSYFARTNRLHGQKQINEKEHITYIVAYEDSDGDGFGDNSGDPSKIHSGCSNNTPNGFVTNATDCNDNAFLINPSTNEVCDNVDNDCDGMIDDSLTLFTYYQDLDNDGDGNIDSVLITCFAEPMPGYSRDSTDCDDRNEFINLNYKEICDNLDNDCNGIVDDNIDTYTYYIDSDNDGFGNPTLPFDTCAISLIMEGISNNNNDCDDTNPDINPAAEEINGNGIDENCDGEDGPNSSSYLLQENSIIISPNPTTEHITITAAYPEYIQDISINSTGGKFMDLLPRSTTEFDLDYRYPLGVYFITITYTTGEKINKKVIKIQ